MKELKEKIWLSFIENFPQYEETTPDFDSIRFEEEEIQGWKLEHEHNLKSIRDFEQWNTVENAKKVLENAGYFVDNLWTVDDVKSKFPKVTDDQAQTILLESLTNEATMGQIWFSIVEFGDLLYDLEEEEEE